MCWYVQELDMSQLICNHLQRINFKRYVDEKLNKNYQMQKWFSQRNDMKQKKKWISLNNMIEKQYYLLVYFSFSDDFNQPTVLRSSIENYFFGGDRITNSWYCLPRLILRWKLLAACIEALFDDATNITNKVLPWQKQ